MTSLQRSRPASLMWHLLAVLSCCLLLALLSQPVKAATGECASLRQVRLEHPGVHPRYRLVRKTQKCWYAPNNKGRSAAHVRPEVRPLPSASRPPARASVPTRGGAPTIAPLAVAPLPVVSSGQDDGTDDIIRALCSNEYGCPTFDNRWRLN